MNTKFYFRTILCAALFLCGTLRAATPADAAPARDVPAESAPVSAAAPSPSTQLVCSFAAADEGAGSTTVLSAASAEVARNVPAESAAASAAAPAPSTQLVCSFAAADEATGSATALSAASADPARNVSAESAAASSAVSAAAPSPSTQLVCSFAAADEGAGSTTAFSAASAEVARDVFAESAAASAAAPASSTQLVCSFAAADEATGSTTALSAASAEEARDVPAESAAVSAAASAAAPAPSTQLVCSFAAADEGAGSTTALSAASADPARNVPAESAAAAAAAAARRTVITAAGATFPLPFYNEAFKAYWEKNDIPVTYAGIGTERGIKSLRSLQIDFAGVDVPLTAEELKEMPAATVLVPTCMGAVVVAYHLDGVDNLRLTGELIADIFMGRIVKWNDARIAAVNPTASLPDKEIYPVFRLDGSGTTYVFSDYLSKVSPAWKESVGTGKSLTFPRGVAATGNPGIAGLVEKIPGAIGYIASEYAFTFDIQRAWLRNAAGNYILPSPESVTAAAEPAGSGSGSAGAAGAAASTVQNGAGSGSVGAAGAAVVPTSASSAGKVSASSAAAHGGAGFAAVGSAALLTDPAAPNAYPISCFSWAMLYKEQNYHGRTREQAAETLRVLRWLVGPEAQNKASQVQFSPLPTAVAARALELLDSVTYDGKRIK